MLLRNRRSPDQTEDARGQEQRTPSAEPGADAAGDDSALVLVTDPRTGATLDVKGDGEGGVEQLGAQCDAFFERLAADHRSRATERSKQEAVAGLPRPDRVEPEDLATEQWLRGDGDAALERWLDFTQRRMQDGIARAVAAFRAQRIRLQQVAAELPTDRSRLRVVRGRLAALRASGLHVVRVGDAGFRRLLPGWLYWAMALGLVAVDWIATIPVAAELLHRDASVARTLADLDERAEPMGLWSGPYRLLARIMVWPEATVFALGMVAILFVLAHFLGESLRSLVALEGGPAATSAVRSHRRQHLPVALVSLVGVACVVAFLFEARDRVAIRTARGWDDAERTLVSAQADVDAARARKDGAALVELRRKLEAARGERELRAQEKRYGESLRDVNAPLLLLNLALALAAAIGAYFHSRHATEGEGRPTPEHDALVDEERALAGRCRAAVAQAFDAIHGMQAAGDRARAIAGSDPWASFAGKKARILGNLHHFRSQNALERGLSTGAIAAFRVPLSLETSDPEGRYVLALPAGFDAELEEAAREAQAARQMLGDPNVGEDATVD